MQPRAAIYARVSTVEQSREDRYSLGEQVHECRVWVGQSGGIVSEQHVRREVVSAVKPLRDRPVLDSLLAALEAGEIDWLVVHDPDRLSRSQVLLGVILDRLERAQRSHPTAALRFVLHDFEQDATGLFILQARTFAAQLQRERILEGSLRGKRGKAKSGKPIGAAAPPFGFRYAEGKAQYEPHPQQAPIVDRMYRLYDGGMSLRQVSRWLEINGIPSPYAGRRHRGNASGLVEGDTWNATTVRRILGSEAYVGRGWSFKQSWTEQPGRLEANRTRLVRVAVTHAVEDRIPLPEGTFPVLVDPKLWGRVQRRLTGNKRESQRSDRDPNEGVFRRGHGACAVCGANLAVRPARVGQGPAYRCSRGSGRGCGRTAISVRLLDEQAWPAVEAVLNRPELIRERLEAHRAADPTAGELAGLDQVLTSVGLKQKKLAATVALLDDDDASAQLLDELRSLGRQRKDIEAEQERLRAERAAWEDGERYLSSALDYTRAVADETRAMSWEDKRLALRRFGVRLKLWPVGYTHRWAITFSWPHPEAPGKWTGTYELDNGWGAQWWGPTPEAPELAASEPGAPAPLFDPPARAHYVLPSSGGRPGG